MKVQEPVAEYARNRDIPTFFGQPMLKGRYTQIDPTQLRPEVPVLFYSHPNPDKPEPKTTKDTKDTQRTLRIPLCP